MALVGLNLTGATYKNRSYQLTNQVTRNFYPELHEEVGVKEKYILQPFPGKKLFAASPTTDPTQLNRGMFAHLGILYKITGQTLYSVSVNGTHTSLGTIPGTNRCIMEGFGSSLVIVSRGSVYVWNGSSITTVTDVDLESPNSVAHLNNQIIYDGDGGRFATSDVGDATSINALNYATAESDPDDLIRVFVFDQVLYLFGDKTIERWYNTGSGNPPFQRIQGGILQVGLAALESVASNDNYLYFLGDDNRVYRTRGGELEVVSKISEYDAIRMFNDKTDAIGFCLTFQGQNFYLLTFPAGDLTLCFSEKTGQWFNLSSGMGTGRDIIDSHAFCFEKNLVADATNGNIYELDIDTFTENGTTIRRVRETGVIHGAMVGAPGKELELNRFELICEIGRGLTTGQGVDPTIMMSISTDGGRTFGTEFRGRVGRLGEYQVRVDWGSLGAAASFVIRIAISDPIMFSIHFASAEVFVGI